jgi:hypothetical protein
MPFISLPSRLFLRVVPHRKKTGTTRKKKTSFENSGKNSVSQTQKSSPRFIFRGRHRRIFFDEAKVASSCFFKKKKIGLLHSYIFEMNSPAASINLLAVTATPAPQLPLQFPARNQDVVLKALKDLSPQEYARTNRKKGFFSTSIPRAFVEKNPFFLFVLACS